MKTEAEVLDDALIVENLGVHYGQRQAIANVAFVSGWGELIAVIGPNGAGKSTMFKAIAGVVPFDGSIRLGGIECHHGAEQAHIAYLPQQADLDRSFPINVGQLVLSGRRPFLPSWKRPRSADHQAIDDALAQVGLSDRREDPIGSLSGGQLQRALVARALAQEAELLLLDESLAGVDTPNTLDLLKLFQTLADEGRTILVATHDLAIVRRHFSRCLAINGTLIADGDPADVLDADSLESTFGSSEVARYSVDESA
ncbi:MAG: metal ABC transporter ATP-binding protein [Actinomycetota bacterium]